MILRATLKQLWHQPVRAVGTFVAISITIACMVAMISILVATSQDFGPAYLLAPADAVVRVGSSQQYGFSADFPPASINLRISDEQLVSIADATGVDTATGFSTAPASLQIAAGDQMPVSVFYATSWNDGYLDLTAGSWPSGDDEIVLPQSLATTSEVTPGDEVLVSTSSGVRPVRISGLFADGDHLDDVVVMDESATTEPGYQFVGITMQSGAEISQIRDQIESVSGKHPLELISGKDITKVDPTSDAYDVNDFGALMGVMAGFMGMVAVFVILNTTNFAIQQRQSQIAIERAIGYTPRQVRISVAIEGLLIAIAGSVMGLILAPIVLRVLMGITSWRGFAPDSFTVSINGTVAGIVVPAMILAVVVVSWWSSRSTLKIPPVAAMREARGGTRKIGFIRWIVGILMSVGVVVMVAISSVIPGVLAMVFSLLLIVVAVIAFSLIGPAIVRGLARIARKLMAREILGEVALSNTRNMAARVASGATPVILGAGFLIMMFCFNATMNNGAMVLADQREQADLYITSVPGAAPTDTAEKLSAIPGVEVVSPMYALDLSTYSPGSDGEYFDVSGFAVDAAAYQQTNQLHVVDGSLDEWRPGGILMSDQLQFDIGGRPGDSVDLVMPDGSVKSFAIAAIVDNTFGAGDVFFHASDVQQTMSSMAPDRIAIMLASNADVLSVEADIQELADSGYPLQLLPRDDYLSVVDKSLNDGSWATYLIIGSAAALGMIASVNTLAMSTMERSRELMLMRLIGATRQQVLGTAAREGLFVGIMSVGIGTGLAMLSALVVSNALVGGIAAISIPLLPTLILVMLALAICVASVVVPTNIALRRDPIEEIGRKE